MTFFFLRKYFSMLLNLALLFTSNAFLILLIFSQEAMKRISRHKTIATL